jgi:hypothetical protein
MLRIYIEGPPWCDPLCGLSQGFPPNTLADREGIRALQIQSKLREASGMISKTIS